MEKFKKIYPFTTENIAGYMRLLNLDDKKIITVTGSGDQALNAILQGCLDIVTFDVNPLAKYYLELKIASIQSLTYDQFLHFLLYENRESLDYSVFQALDLSFITRLFWLKKYKEVDYSGRKLRNSDLFNFNYFNSEEKKKCNLYLEKDKYVELQQKLKMANITFINQSLQNLQLNTNYDYMFLSNIADYLNTIYDKDVLYSFKNLLNYFQKNVSIIYIAYLYDLQHPNKVREIENLPKVFDIFTEIELLSFDSALYDRQEAKDGVLILKKGGKRNE